MKFLIAAMAADGQRTWIEEFPDRERAREQVARRGFTVMVARPATDEEAGRYRRLGPSDEDILRRARETRDWSEVPAELIEREAAGIVVTTSPFLARGRVARELGIVTAECCYGMNLFRDLFALARDAVGGRSASVQNALRDARRVVLIELKREALMLGAGAVVAARLDYEPMGDGKMLLVVAQGTAVELKK